mmetsp:Transcript_27453/g.58736  ORF Transcript_27453/g.58736 Transcript_27453/m.58736 type:complete len:661 (+) Transcript_27453:171-2153(+)|eukprot:CAMPEP_0201123754 /NCGR_PEP_ID=MMETSP0850-20130426/9068_1 /ASSEMBLY_ACC=CAM_ASM_000622 /TAXON_ID=183588 /ORGANISM="Pseudo-nitzschia fraudulenta, Strain WWA7" /LENGTH=660 /DNA_ID=CAMNT_0047390823 /DNA_START=135 /DNA_END=2117 /DNA_ORIENTATION=+
MSIGEDSPSAERRKALKEADASNQLRILASCPFSKYADLADRLLDHFQDAVDGRRLDEAYVFGLRFANMCLSSLPQHPEWKAGSTSKARKRLTSQVGDVLCMMDVIKQRMDGEELMKEMIEKQEEEARKKEVEDRQKSQVENEQQREQKILQALENERARFLDEQRSQQQLEIEERKRKIETKTKAIKKEEVKNSAMAKLQAMQARMSATENKPIEPTGTKHDVSVVPHDKSMEGLENIQTKEKEPSKLKRLFGIGKKKSNFNLKEDNTTLPSSYPINPSGTKDGATSLYAASITDKEGGITTKPPNGAATLHDLYENFAQSLPHGGDNVKATTIVVSAQKKESEINVPTDTKSTANIVNSKTSDANSTSSSHLKHSIPKSSTKSEVLSKKSKTSIVAMVTKKKQTLSMPCAKNSEAHQRISNESKSSPQSLPTGKKTVDGSISDATASIIEGQLAPRSRREKATINKLQRAIASQEDRLEMIEGKQIPTLLDGAKFFLKDNNRQEALKCLVHKKRLERQVDTIKAAVFNMETQMFMLESAFEDRHVKKALDEAATAIAGFQQSIDDDKIVDMNLTEMTASLPELEVGDATDEELMEELEEWLSPEEKRKAKQNSNEEDHGDDISMLSMPVFLPRTPVAKPVARTNFPSVDGILKALVGG